MALFTIVMLWNQPRCPSKDEWVKKCTMEYYPAIKNTNHVIFRKMDRTGGHHVNQNKSDKERQLCMFSFICGS
jgi:hypothetical protein